MDGGCGGFTSSVSFMKDKDFANEPELEWLLIDASHVKVHPHACGAIGGNQDMGRTKGG